LLDKLNNLKITITYLKIINQVKILIKEFCAFKKMPLPELSELSQTQSDSGNASTVNSDDERELVPDDDPEVDDEGINEEKAEM